MKSKLLLLVAITGMIVLSADKCFAESQVNYKIAKDWETEFDKPFQSDEKPIIEEQTYVVYKLNSPVKNGNYFVYVDKDSKQVLKTLLEYPEFSWRKSMADFSKSISEKTGLDVNKTSQNQLIVTEPAPSDNASKREIIFTFIRPNHVIIIHNVSTSQLDKPIEGAFGIKLGEKFNPDWHYVKGGFSQYDLVQIKPPVAPDSFFRFYASFTPKTERIYALEGTTNSLKDIKNAIAKKYDPVLTHLKSFTYINGSRMITLTDSGVKYLDTALQEQVKAEKEALEKEKAEKTDLNGL